MARSSTTRSFIYLASFLAVVWWMSLSRIGPCTHRRRALESAISDPISPTRPPTTHHWSKYMSHADPGTTVISREILYVWCGVRKFQFRHYLSMKSAIRILLADSVYFLYATYPPVEQRYPYSTWLDDLTEEYPFIHFMQVAEHDACHNHKTKTEYVIGKLQLSQNGGFYLHEDIIITPDIRQLVDEKAIYGLNNDGVGILALHKLSDLESSAISVVCNDWSRSLINQEDILCINSDKNLRHPRDIWEGEDAFSELARWIYYGEPSPIYPTYSEETMAPNIAHVVWLGGGAMDFLFYMSVMSMLHVGHVDRVYIHGEAPNGPYWDRIKDNPKITVVYRSQYISVYGTLVEPREHKSDVVRVDILSKYGGVYMDKDAIMTRPMDTRIRAFDAVIGVCTGSDPAFPLHLMNGVMVGKQGAPFWTKYMESMRHYNDRSWVWNSLVKPYKIKERFPKSVFIDPHMQLVCWDKKCKPSSWYRSPDQKPSSINLPGIPDWWQDVYFYHWTGIVPEEFKDGKILSASNSSFAIIVKRLFTQADILDIVIEDI